MHRKTNLQQLKPRYFSQNEQKKPLKGELFNKEQLIEYAEKLAVKQQVAGGTRNNYLPERLNYNEIVLQEFNKTTLSYQKPRHITPATEWLIDNFYLIEEHIQLARRHFPKQYNRDLPCLLKGSYAGLPRIYNIVIKLLSHVDSQIDKESLHEFFQAYQSKSVLKLGELWAVPIMLRLALIENLQRIATRLLLNQQHRDLAGRWVDKLEAAASKRASGLVEVVSDMAKSEIPLSSSFVAEFCQRLSSQNSALQIARTWLDQKLAEEGLTSEELIYAEGQHQAANQLTVSHSITSLRFLNSADWKNFVETLSLVEQTLHTDPTGVYGKMDFATRDYYRHVVEELAQKSLIPEPEVAKQAVLLAEVAEMQNPGTRCSHVGYYLIGDGRNDLYRLLGIKRNMKAKIRRVAGRRPLLFYAGSITLLTLLITLTFVFFFSSSSLSFLAGHFILLSLFVLLIASQMAVFLVNWLSALLLKPDRLGRLDFSKGITPDCRTIVVIPTMISNEASVDKLIANLELLYLSNRDAYLHFALLTDFVDASQEEAADDLFLLERTRAGIETLNLEYASEKKDLFFLFHRPRRWNAGEKCWMGYERKRGKLMALNTFLKEGEREAFSTIEGCTAPLSSVKYVITLDTDTQLPPETAYKLIGTMAHPLNRPEFDPIRNVVIKGYGILQPRVATRLQSTRVSRFSRWFTDESGIDPYTRAVSDVYQDIFHEGSFIGKGIYEVDAFERVLGNRFPENKILSHDLIESTYVRSGLVSDIELYENYPSGYHMDATRRHRWIRGDWQIIQWLFPRVPTLHQGREKNPVSALGRWKIADNLRRSLVPPATLLFLIGFCLLFPQYMWLGLILLMVVAILPFLMVAVTNAIRKSKDLTWKIHLHEVIQKGGHQLRQLLFSLVMLPYDAYLCTDAIVRTLWRLVISRKHLMRWQASADADLAAPNSLSAFYRRMWFSPFFALLSMVLLGLYDPILLYTLPVLLVWLLAPAFAWWLSLPVKEKIPVITKEQHLLLHRIARKTWFFFEEFVTREENGLPPDNFQEVPEPVIAHRTSPTNIGLSLLSNLAAFDFGYLSAGGVVERTKLTLETVASLEKFRGHLYNWYDTQTLQPLHPLYVSSVDSGNLAGHLITLAQGLKELACQPIYNPVIFEGLLDTVRIMQELDKQNSRLAGIEKELLKPLPETLQDVFIHLQSLRSQVEEYLLLHSEADKELQQWGARCMANCDDHLDELLYLAPWVEFRPDMLFEEPDIPFLKKWSDEMSSILQASDKIRDLQGIVEFEQEAVSRTEELRNQMIQANHLTEEQERYFRRWTDCFKTAAKHARERLHWLNVLSFQSDAFARMDFTFLYHPVKKLFTIGYNVEEQRADTGSYDMLASEARLCSYVAIAQGQVPQEHWFSLSRLLILPHGNPILLSWSGSMFEYLMPLLVMPGFDQTLLDQTYKGMLREQIDYGRKFHVPWGISESGFHRTDTHFNYQYKAFGIPSLGLKRGLSKDLVIAPYATLLALMVSPRKACENMQRLSKEGYENTYGYYEAIDYTPSHLPLNEKSITVRSFMAHHQGMGLLSLANLMKGNAMQQRFMASPVLKAFELLLQERIPRSITANIISDDSKFELEGVHPLLSDNLHVSRVFHDPDSFPEINLLTNGRYQVMINHNGAGYSRWNHLAVTRWREDITCDNNGLFVYLRDPKTGEFWSVGHQPTLNHPKEYEVKFTQAYAEFCQKQAGLDILTTICVSPEDDIELRRISITNRSSVSRVIELTSYSEVAITSQADDESHPAFSNLFVQTQFNPGLSALFCTRRARSKEEKPPFLLHLMLTAPENSADLSCETDRSLFIGRNGSLTHPQAMQSPGSLSGSEGAVLDPVVALRRTVTIPPGKTISVCVALGMAETEETALSLAHKYQNIRMTERAFELAWSHSQISLYQINITAAEAQVYAKLAGALLYINPSYRADTAILKTSRREQSGLWAYSISGDVPLVVLRVNDQKGLELVRQLVLAHAYWRMKGLTVELMILNEDTSVYRQPLHDEIINLISGGVEAPLLESAGGIFVRRIEQIPREDVLLLLASARIVLYDKEGSLPDQLKKRKTTKLQIPELKPGLSAIPSKEAPLPERELIFSNTVGGFTRDGQEYVIMLNPGETTPAPWCNVLANEHFGTVISESGSAYTWALNAHEFRLTPWHNDPVKDTSGEAFYIRDEETGQYWSPTPWPARGDTPYVIRHGFGYSVFEHSEYGIESELWVYVALDSAMKFSVLKLRNVSGRPRKVSVTGYYEWILGDRKAKTAMHIQTEIDVQTGALLARNFYHPDFAGKIAFIDVGEPRTVTGDRKEFIGSDGTPGSPAAMKQTRLSGRSGAGFDACGAMQVVYELPPGEEKEGCFRLGFAHHKDEMKQMITRYRQPGAVRKELEKVWHYWNHTLGTINVDTPDAAVNVLANGWLLYQTLSSRIWGRSGFYQSGGAYGFRDQLQDVMALVHAAPQTARKHILLAARHQYLKGDVQHWWHPPTDRGVRTHFSDDYLWLPFVVSHYVSSVADTGILDEMVPFIEGRELRPDEESYYDQPFLAGESASLYEHCVRSIRYGLKFGIHGLPLMGCGDWNDGMNKVGEEGKGESVWLAFFLYDVLKKFAAMAVLHRDEFFAAYCRDQADELRNNIRQHAWDGQWYRRAYFDNGEPLGSARNEECSIDAIPQSWSVISGAGDPERSLMGMQQVDLRLVDREAGVIKLFDPPFDKSALNPGYIKGYIPGVRENGGQYTHSAIWTAWAFALMGETDKAWELFDLINPVHHASTFEKMRIYKIEPYVIAADVYAATQHKGRGGWSWYTGSASWMYRFLTETLLGINRTGDQLRLHPLMRSGWDMYKVHYRHIETVYHITFHRITDTSEPRLILDGQEQTLPDTFSMADDRIEHFVEMWMLNK